LFQREEQHAWKEGIEMNPLVQFVSKLENDLYIQMSSLEPIKAIFSRTWIIIQTPLKGIKKTS
jgi:hypothetical protein